MWLCAPTPLPSPLLNIALKFGQLSYLFLQKQTNTDEGRGGDGGLSCWCITVAVKFVRQQVFQQFCPKLWLKPCGWVLLRVQIYDDPMLVFNFFATGPSLWYSSPWMCSSTYSAQVTKLHFTVDATILNMYTHRQLKICFRKLEVEIAGSNLLYKRENKLCFCMILQ